MKPWPKLPDGRPMMVSEMSTEQRKEVFREAGKRLQDELNHPAMQEKFAAMLRGDSVMH